MFINGSLCLFFFFNLHLVSLRLSCSFRSTLVLSSFSNSSLVTLCFSYIIASFIPKFILHALFLLLHYFLFFLVALRRVALRFSYIAVSFFSLITCLDYLSAPRSRIARSLHKGSSPVTPAQIFCLCALSGVRLSRIPRRSHIPSKMRDGMRFSLSRINRRMGNYGAG